MGLMPPLTMIARTSQTLKSWDLGFRRIWLTMPSRRSTLEPTRLIALSQAHEVPEFAGQLHPILYVGSKQLVLCASNLANTYHKPQAARTSRAFSPVAPATHLAAPLLSLHTYMRGTEH